MMASIIHPQFKESWDLYEIVSRTVDKTEAIRLATILHVARADAVE